MNCRIEAPHRRPITRSVFLYGDETVISTRFMGESSNIIKKKKKKEKTCKSNSALGIVPIKIPPRRRYLDTFSIIILAFAAFSNA